MKFPVFLLLFFLFITIPGVFSQREEVITKNEANAFPGTDFLEFLKEKKEFDPNRNANPDVLKQPQEPLMIMVLNARLLMMPPWLKLVVLK